MEPMIPQPPEQLPVTPQVRLREAVKPKNRSRDIGGILISIGAAAVLVAGEVIAHTADIIHVLTAFGADPGLVETVARALALAGAIYAAVTRHADPPEVA